MLQKERCRYNNVYYKYLLKNQHKKCMPSEWHDFNTIIVWIKSWYIWSINLFIFGIYGIYDNWNKYFDLPNLKNLSSPIQT